MKKLGFVCLSTLLLSACSSTAPSTSTSSKNDTALTDYRFEVLSEQDLNTGYKNLTLQIIYDKKTHCRTAVVTGYTRDGSNNTSVLMGCDVVSKKKSGFLFEAGGYAVKDGEAKRQNEVTILKDNWTGDRYMVIRGSITKYETNVNTKKD